MALNIFTSNRMENLVEACAEVLKRPLAAPLTPEVIIVQSRGMQRWLSMELAKRFGVWANCDFPFPNAMIWQLCAAVLPEVKDSSPFTPEVLTWKILELFPGLLEQEAFLPLRHYLVDDREGLKSYQLAEKIADTFDQYTLFRPELLQRWEEGEAEDWQGVLWRQLVAGSAEPHRGQVMAAYRKAILAGGGKSPGIPERLSLFGISYLPKHHLDILASTARITEVNLFLLSPTREYWADIRSHREQARLTSTAGALQVEGHPLLASLGKLGRDFSDLVIEAGELAVVQQDLYCDPGRATLLQALQSDILLLTEGETGHDRSLLAAQDQSVQIHACHSPLREVEVLHDHLLALLEEQNGLEPRDILVMTPDIETYAPYIATVFAGGQDPALKIPFSIADRSLASEGQIAAVLLKLLQLPGGRLTVVELLDLLEARPVCRRFDLREDELALIRTWLEAVRVRWGLDEQDRVRCGLPPYRENSLQAGLDRLLLGYALPALKDELFNDIVPYDEIEGSNAATLGKLCAFVSCLARWRRALSQPRSLKGWSDELRAMLADCVAEEEETAAEAATVAALVADFGDLEAKAACSADVTLDVVRCWFGERLQQTQRSFGFMTGGVTFCAMLPMRSIPFKVVALIGMSDGAFPRQGRPPGFDLIARHPRRGDRSVRDEDRYLFLEALLSARNTFYLSYLGQSIKDNSELPPSVLVSEFLDAVARRFSVGDGSTRALEERLVRRHRLQAFSPDYFRPDSPLFSFSAENCHAQRARQQGVALPPPFLSAPLAEPPPEWRDVPLAALLRFFANPAKFFLEQRLNIRLQGVAAPLAEREAFAVEGLEAYTLKEELLERALAGEDLQRALPTFRACGLLPPGRHGEVAFAAAAAASTDFAAEVKAQLHGQRPLEDVDFALDLGDFRLSGRLQHLWPQGRIPYRSAKLKAKDLLQTWIAHLLLNVVGPVGSSRETRLVMTDGVTTFAPVAAAAACLQQLLELYWQGLSQPLRFFPVSALAYAKNREWNLDRARAAWEDGFFHEGEKNDPHFRLCFGAPSPFDAEFERIARTVLEPLLQHMS